MRRHDDTDSGIAQLQHDLSSWRTPEVRDLAWVMVSPSLVDAEQGVYAGQTVSDAWCRGQLEAQRGWLAALDRDPSPLLDYLAAPTNRRLGAYFERLLAYWLRHLPQIRFHASGVIVRDAERTLGEFDLLFFDGQRQQAIHWEVTVKFYLCHCQPEGCRFYGPNARDRWDIKIPRLYQRQIALAKHPESARVLADAGWSSLRAEALVRGYLFYPLSEAWQTAPHRPGAAARGHLRGWWIHHGQALPGGAPEDRWRPLSRLQWLSPARSNDTHALHTAEEMAQWLDAHFHERDSGVLLAQMRPGDDGWEEVSRGFVVARDWPHIP